MALTTFVIYDNVTGEIAYVCNGDDGEPPTAPDGHNTLDCGLMSPMPTRATHKVSDQTWLLISKTQQEQDDEANAELKKQLRRQIALAELIKDQYIAETWDTADITQEITDLRARHDALP